MERVNSVNQQHRDKMNLEREKQAEVSRKNQSDLELKRRDLEIKNKVANNKPKST